MERSTVDYDVIDYKILGLIRIIERQDTYLKRDGRKKVAPISLGYYMHNNIKAYISS